MNYLVTFTTAGRSKVSAIKCLRALTASSIEGMWGLMESKAFMDKVYPTRDSFRCIEFTLLLSRQQLGEFYVCNNLNENGADELAIASIVQHTENNFTSIL